MAVPASHFKSEENKRRTHYKLTAPSIYNLTKQLEITHVHTVYPLKGYYKGRKNRLKLHQLNNRREIPCA